MNQLIDLIYCAKGNRILAEIAIEEGWLYGAQPGKVYFPPTFTDLDYKKGLDTAYLTKYKAWVKKHQPKYAVAPDLINPPEINFILKWASSNIAPFTENIILVPKIIGLIKDLPAKLNNTNVVLGYSIPSQYGATSVPDWEFSDKPVHLLGGTPKRQFEVYRYLPNIVSADLNVHSKMATQLCLWWDIDTHAFSDPIQGQGYKEAFRRSCKNIMTQWRIQQEE